MGGLSHSFSLFRNKPRESLRGGENHQGPTPSHPLRFLGVRRKEGSEMLPFPVAVLECYTVCQRVTKVLSCLFSLSPQAQANRTCSTGLHLSTNNQPPLPSSGGGGGSLSSRSALPFSIHSCLLNRVPVLSRFGRRPQ